MKNLNYLIKGNKRNMSTFLVSIHLRKMKIYYILILFMLNACQSQNSELEKLLTIDKFLRFGI